MNRLCVVLAGGEGRRMGGAKPLRRLAGVRLIDHALQIARGYAEASVVTVRDPAQVGSVDDAALILDAPDIPGPLGGLASALRLARAQGADRVLAIPCDAPRLPPDLYERLEMALDTDARALAAVASSGGRPHPVCALWSVEAAPRLRPFVASGRTSLKGFAAEIGYTLAEWSIAGGDPFTNANTPEDLATLE